MLYPKPSSGNGQRRTASGIPVPSPSVGNISAKRSAPQKRKKKKISIIYWLTVLALSSWMIYLNITVVFEYRGASAKYEAVLQEYETKKKELEEKMQEYQRLRSRMEEHGLQ